MNISDFPRPENLAPYCSEPDEIDYLAVLIKSRESFDLFMKKLAELGYLWGSGISPEKHIPKWATPTYVEGFILFYIIRGGPVSEYFYQSATLDGLRTQIINIDWNIKTNTKSNNYCSCKNPQIRQVFVGIAGGGSYYNYCSSCAMEVKI